MAIRKRLDGTLICAAMSDAEEGDTYIDDGLHYLLSVESKAILADVDHEKNGLWHWVSDLSTRAVKVDWKENKNG